MSLLKWIWQCRQNTRFRAFRLNPNLAFQQNTGWKACPSESRFWIVEKIPDEKLSVWIRYLDCRQNTGWKAFGSQIWIWLFDTVDDFVDNPDSDFRIPEEKLSVWIRYLKCSTQIPDRQAFRLNPNPDCRENTGWKAFRLNPVSGLSTKYQIRKAFHLNRNLAFRSRSIIWVEQSRFWIQTEGFSVRYFVDNPDSNSDGRLFSPVSGLLTIQIRIQTEGFSSGILSRTIQIPDSDGRLPSESESGIVDSRQYRFGFRRKPFYPVFCRQSRFGFRWKAFHPVFCWHSRFGFRWKVFHPVFCRHIQIQMEGFSSGIQNVLLKWASTVSTIRIRIQTGRSNPSPVFNVEIPDSDGRLFIRYLKCSTQMSLCIDSVDNLDSGWQKASVWIRYLDCRQSRFRMKGFSSGILKSDNLDSNDGQCRQSGIWDVLDRMLFIRHFVNNPDLDSDGRLFIRYLKCSTQMIDSVNNPDSDSDGRLHPIRQSRRLFIWYLKCSTQMIDSVNNPDSDSDGRLFIRYFVDNPDSDSDGRLFIRYLKCSTQMILVSTVSTIRINWGLFEDSERLFIQYLKCSTQMIDSVWQSRLSDSFRRKAFHPVFCLKSGFRWKAFHPDMLKLFYSSTVSNNPDWDSDWKGSSSGILSTIQIRIQTEGFSSSIWNVLLKWSTVSTIQIPDEKPSIWIQIRIVDKIPDEKPSVWIWIWIFETVDKPCIDSVNIPDEKPSVWIQSGFRQNFHPDCWNALPILKSESEHCRQYQMKSLPSESFRIRIVDNSGWKAFCLNIGLLTMSDHLSRRLFKYRMKSLPSESESGLSTKYQMKSLPISDRNLAFRSGIWNVLLKWSTVSTIQIPDSEKASIWIRYFVDKIPDEKPSDLRSESGFSTLSIIWNRTFQILDEKACLNPDSN